MDRSDYSLPVYPVAVLSHANPRGKGHSPLLIDFTNKRVLEFDFDIIDPCPSEIAAALKKHSMHELLRRGKMRTMTPEERFERIERTLEFLAANQAQLTASVQSHDALIAENSRQIAENSKAIGENSGRIVELTDLTLRIGRIVEEQGRRMDEMGRQTDGRIKALVDAQARTDERMGDLADRINALINVAERYFSNGRH